MNKENNKSAAGLRRSAMAERIRLREEWSALKGPHNENDRQNNILAKKPQNIKNNKRNVASNTHNMRNKDPTMSPISEILRGIVVLVDIGSEPKALALRAALMALGASVMPTWSPLVTHVVWSQGGCTKTRAKARALACKLVSPIWVESCAASARRLPESMFPAVSRPSDLPSPCTLRKILRRMDQENIPLNLLSESQEGDKRPPRLRISSETENNTTNTTQDTSQDTSYDKSHDESRDKSKDNENTDINKKVNTAPRRAIPISKSPRPKKSKRKLFTQKEAEITTSGDESGKETPLPKQKTIKNITKEGRKELAQAERMARKLLGTPKSKNASKNNKGPRIVLTGMSRRERHDMFHAIHKLNGIIQNNVNKKTTHILLGSCIEPSTNAANTIKRKNPIIMCQKCNSPEKILTQMFENNVTVTKSPQNVSNNLICNCDISGINILSQNNISQNVSQTIIRTPKRNLGMEKEISKKNIISQTDKVIVIRNEIINTQLQNVNNESQSIINNQINGNEDLNENLNLEQENENLGNVHRQINENGINNLNNDNLDNINVLNVNDKPRTVNALLGAVRGCRVLFPTWVKDSVKNNKWLHHFGYEVPHLMKISQKARIERLALNKMSCEYAYDVFNGMKIKVSENAEQKDAVKQLLSLCGAITELPKQDGGQVRREGGSVRHYGGLVLGKRGKKQKEVTTKTKRTHNVGTQPQDGGPTFDITIGREIGEISSKWVFDSIAAARMRTTRRYMHNKDDDKNDQDGHKISHSKTD